ncbi:unnamed protein product, partial [Pylaiella littoralis]
MNNTVQIHSASTLLSTPHSVVSYPVTATSSKRLVAATANHDGGNAVSPGQRKPRKS